MIVSVLTINLYLWSFVGRAGQYGENLYDFRFSGEYRTVEACHKAAKNLNKSDVQHRCIDSNGDVK